MTYKILINGIVQGVGFRPFVYKLANQMSIKGEIINSSSGVEILLNCDSDILSKFIQKINHDLPILAHISEINTAEVNEQNFSTFTIKESKITKGEITLVSPDTAVCLDCEKELNDINDKRYLYPFINCTNCGPRYSIISSLPYDRENTAMSNFNMCSECSDEYHSPDNRRFHAQPNCCKKCGPNVWMEESKGINAVKKCAELINNGSIANIKGLGGYHILCDASNIDTVTRLKKLKGRDYKPLALMVRDLSTLKKYYPNITECEENIISSPQSPIVITNWNNADFSEYINPVNGKIGVMLPYTPIHKVLFKFLNTDFIVATSGNIKEEPICKSISEAESTLSIYSNHFLHHDRKIINRVDDSIAADVNGKVYLLRRSRGFAPYPVMLPYPSKQVIAGMGAHLKSHICLVKDRYAFVSQYIGDLDNVKTSFFYEETFSKMCNMFSIQPSVVVIDKHPEYYSTLFGEETANTYKTEIFKVQHHVAHVFACMAENSITDNVIGVAFDGAGFGNDGTIWGSEFFIIDKGVERWGSLKYYLQPGIESAIKNPFRMMLGYIIQMNIFDKAEDILKNIFHCEYNEINILNSLISKKINCIYTSSAGRLFEAVGSLLSGIKINEFEGHTAMMLESLSEKSTTEDFYEFDIINGTIEFSHIITGIISDIKYHRCYPDIAKKFHNTIAEIILQQCVNIRKLTSINKVALSGGVFQNIHLLKLVINRLEKKGFTFFIHSKVPSNDASISLGQCYNYLYSLQQTK